VSRPWTEEEDIELLRHCLRLDALARTDAMDAAIAWKLKRSRAAVRSRRYTLAGVLRQEAPRWPMQRINRALLLREAGLSLTAIAKEIGTTRCAVSGQLHRLRRKQSRGDPVMPGGGRAAARKER
jgi:hypothetical protein